MDGYLDVPDNVNRVCPPVKPIKIMEYLEKWWGGLDLPGSSREDY